MIGIRRAIALLILGFYVSQFAMVAWLGPDELYACYLALSLCYGLAFVALAAEWFWARWFAIGVGNFGSLVLLLLFQVGLEPVLTVVGFSHLAVALLLLGEGMASRYEHSEITAERWNFQEESLVLLRRAVKSAGSTIPFLILYGLAPRPEIFQLAALGCGIAGLWGLLRGRTWGILALGTAGVVALLDTSGWFGAPPIGIWVTAPIPGAPVIYGSIMGWLAGGLVIVPLLWARPMIRFMRGSAIASPSRRPRAT